VVGAPFIASHNKYPKTQKRVFKMNKKIIKVAAVQTMISKDLNSNLKSLISITKDAAKSGAQIILLPELFEYHYFCKEQKDEFFSLANEVQDHPFLSKFQDLCRELKIVMPVSFFEKASNAYYNSIAIIDADGSMLGTYRKSHIPDGPGYEEKFYFRPGDSGFKVWQTRYAKIGVGICWDQWYPEAARAMVLEGAEVLFYPTAIGSEPANPSLETKDPWQRAMQGHAVSNICPVVAANRTGDEEGQSFYGHSFLTNELGEITKEIGNGKEGFISQELDLDKIAKHRASWGFFRDRRPELYSVLSTADGRKP